MTIISPSILSCNFANLEKEIKKVEPYVPWIHIDVMDGHFVPNISIGIPIIKSIRNITNLFFDVHLMIENPEKYTDAFIDAGADLITFHYEAANDKTPKIIEQIKNRGKKVGLSIKPKTNPNEIKDYIDLCDLILIMTVEPGFGGQQFMENCAYKIIDIKKLSRKNDLIIQIDGGINDSTGRLCTSLGANSLVAGNYIYKSENIKQAIELLKK